MKVIRAVNLILNYPQEIFSETLKYYTDAVNKICKRGWEDQDFNRVSLQHKLYYELRKTLPSSLSIEALDKATQDLHTIRALQRKGRKVSCPQSKQSCILFDNNGYNVWFDRNEISIGLLRERKKFNIQVPEYFKQYITWRRHSATLFVKRNKVYFTIIFSKEITDPIPNNKYIGVDRGITNIAVTSNKHFYGGSHVKHIIKKYQLIKSKLQARHTRSAKRHLKRLSLKENRFRTNVNHIISKQIVASCEPGTTIVFENLTNIRENSRNYRKESRKAIHEWAFYQLETFLRYKAQNNKCFVALTDPRYTSQKCNKCGYTAKNNRKDQSRFKCKKCGYQVHADLNAAFNIRNNYQDAIRHLDRAAVNQPIVTRNTRNSGVTNSRLFK